MQWKTIMKCLRLKVESTALFCIISQSQMISLRMWRLQKARPNHWRVIYKEIHQLKVLYTSKVSLSMSWYCNVRCQVVLSCHHNVITHSFLAVSAVKPLKKLIQDTIDYTKDRKIFGTPVLSNQSVHFRLAELETEVECFQALLYRALGECWHKSHNGIGVARLTHTHTHKSCTLPQLLQCYPQIAVILWVFPLVTVWHFEPLHSLYLLHVHCLQKWIPHPSFWCFEGSESQMFIQALSSGFVLLRGVVFQMLSSCMLTFVSNFWRMLVVLMRNDDLVNNVEKINQDG